jgi:hypothetical protein
MTHVCTAPCAPSLRCDADGRGKARASPREIVSFPDAYRLQDAAGRRGAAVLPDLHVHLGCRPPSAGMSAVSVTDRPSPGQALQPRILPCRVALLQTRASSQRQPGWVTAFTRAVSSPCPPRPANTPFTAAVRSGRSARPPTATTRLGSRLAGSPIAAGSQPESHSCRPQPAGTSAVIRPVPSSTRTSVGPGHRSTSWVAPRPSPPRPPRAAGTTAFVRRRERPAYASRSGSCANARAPGRRRQRSGRSAHHRPPYPAGIQARTQPVRPDHRARWTRNLTGDRVVPDRAETVDVGPLVDSRPGHGLFGRPVPVRTSGLGEPRGLCVVDGPRSASSTRRMLSGPVPGRTSFVVIRRRRARSPTRSSCPRPCAGCPSAG